MTPAERAELVRLLNSYRAELTAKRDAAAFGIAKHFVSHAVRSADDLIRQLEGKR